MEEGSHIREVARVGDFDGGGSFRAEGFLCQEGLVFGKGGSSDCQMQANCLLGGQLQTPNSVEIDPDQDAGGQGWEF